MKLLGQLALSVAGVGLTSVLLDNDTAKEQRFLHVGDDIELYGWLGADDGGGSVYFCNGKDLRKGDVLVLSDDKGKIDAKLCRVSKVIGTYVGTHLRNGEKSPELLYIVEQEYLRDSDDYDAIHEKYMDWIGIPL